MVFVCKVRVKLSHEREIRFATFDRIAEINSEKKMLIQSLSENERSFWEITQDLYDPILLIKIIQKTFSSFVAREKVEDLFS